MYKFVMNILQMYQYTAAIPELLAAPKHRYKPFGLGCLKLCLCKIHLLPPC
jgi:hypothetical protein